MTGSGPNSYLILAAYRIETKRCIPYHCQAWCLGACLISLKVDYLAVKRG